MLGGGWYSTHLEGRACAFADSLGVTHMPGVLHDPPVVDLHQEVRKNSEAVGEWVWVTVRSWVLSALSLRCLFLLGQVHPQIWPSEEQARPESTFGVVSK